MNSFSDIEVESGIIFKGLKEGTNYVDDIDRGPVFVKY